MLTILPGFGVSTSGLRTSKALAEPSGQRRSPRPWAREGAFFRPGTALCVPQTPSVVCRVAASCGPSAVRVPRAAAACVGFTGGSPLRVPPIQGRALRGITKDCPRGPWQRHAGRCILRPTGTHSQLLHCPETEDAGASPASELGNARPKGTHRTEEPSLAPMD